jgi:hypothetical protein
LPHREKEKDKETEPQLELDVSIGDKKYFLRQASSGFVVGPKSKDGLDQHITIATDKETEEIKHIHMKSGRGGILHEVWRIWPDQVMPDIASWVRTNAVPLGEKEILGLEKSSYSISARRVITIFRIVDSATQFVGILIRGIGLVQFSEVEDGAEKHFRAVIDARRLLKVMRRLRPFRKPIEVVIRGSLPRVLMRLFKLHLVKLKDMAEGDVCVVFPRLGPEPVVIIKHGSYLSIPLARVFKEANDWYSRLKIAELWPRFDFSPGKPLPMEFKVRGSSPG